MQPLNLSEALEAAGPGQRFACYRRLWRLAGEHAVLTDFPMHLDIELSAVCNLRCEHCFQNGLLEGRLGLMSRGLFTRIIDEGRERGLCAVKLQVRGESFLHPELFAFIAYAKDAGIMDVQITTNATLLDAAAIERTLQSGLDGIIFSFDRHHAESHRRRRGDYLAIEEGIRAFLAARARHGRSAPWVRVQASVAESDPGACSAYREHLLERFPLAESVAVNRLHDFSYERDSYPDLHRNYRLLPCNYPMQRLAVFWDGAVTVCCMDYNNRFALGDARAQTIAGIWLSPALARFRERQLAGRRRQMPVCGACLVNAVPQTGAVFLDQSPRHGAEVDRS